MKTEVNPELLKILACPKCKAPVNHEADTLRCAGPACGLIYPVRNGVPIMLVEAAVSPDNHGGSAAVR